MTDTVLTALVGRRVTAVHWSDDVVTFETDKGLVTFEVYGDCCSTSYFHDLIGLDKLLAGPVVSTNEVALDDFDSQDGYTETQCYGYQIVTEHPTFGEVTTALSFRNDSNGYYGGSMEQVEVGEVRPEQRRLDADVVG